MMSEEKSSRYREAWSSNTARTFTCTFLEILDKIAINVNVNFQAEEGDKIYT